MAAVAAGALVAMGGLISIGDTATADPKQYSAVTGTGSDTTQDVVNALAGFTSGNTYTPVQSSALSGKRQIASWDATPVGTCITPKAPGATFDRPNGSSAGRRALSRSIDGATFGTAACGGLKAISGLVQFARSSAGPSGAGTDLTYVPFGRDALSFAAYRSDGGAKNLNLSAAQLTSIFSTGPTVIGGLTIIPCSIQTSSGTYAFWNTALGVTTAQMLAATSGTAGDCFATSGGTIQENDGNGLKAAGDAFGANTQVIIGFSAANFIAQSNGVVTSQLPLPLGTVDLGGIGALSNPYNGTAPALTPDVNFYASSTFGRDVYNVLPTSVVTGLGNDDQKTLFVGSGSAVCSALSTIQTFGFLGLGGSCGSTTLQGPLVSGSAP
ncbi:MAG: hypothetical protein ABIX10_00355 [Acidimicrobiales bacterium]